MAKKLTEIVTEMGTLWFFKQREVAKRRYHQKQIRDLTEKEYVHQYIRNKYLEELKER